MKKLVGCEAGSYTFNASMKQITLSGFDNIALEDFLLITNVRTNTIIYNFADSNCGGVLTGNVLTLAFDTTTMNNSDPLQIFVMDAQNNTDELLAILKLIRKLLESNAVTDGQQRQRIVVDSLNSLNGSILGSSTTLGGNIVTVGAPSLGTGNYQQVWEGPVDQRWRIIDAARAAYAAGIRQNLQFS